MKLKMILGLALALSLGGVASAAPIIPIPVPVPVPFPVGPGPGPVRPLTCFARDVAGRTFSATGRWMNRSNVERRALNACFTASPNPRTCVAAGCN